MKWGNLSHKTKEIMLELGNYTPTSGGDMIKGYIGENQEGQSYLDAEDLRDMAKAFIEVAVFLEDEV
jgi:hypothetical protein